jgi:hypothetical protein
MVGKTHRPRDAEVGAKALPGEIKPVAALRTATGADSEGGAPQRAVRHPPMNHRHQTRPKQATPLSLTP